MNPWRLSAFLLLSAVGTACHNQGSRPDYPATEHALNLKRVVLYRNGVGYFERQGEVANHELRIKVRKDQINDLLKSLTVVDRNSGSVLSVSMPLDPKSWANAALATLSPGQGSLAQVLDALRGSQVTLGTTRGMLSGRIVMVERIDDEPDPIPMRNHGHVAPQPLGRDHRITLMEGKQLQVVRLSKVRDIELEDGDLAMQFHRSLNATAGEGMFQQVEVTIRLSGDSPHDLIVSYVVAAPMWKPTYRVVLPKDGKGEALLQAWAVVDNTSGEDWRDVHLALTAGAPIAFRYDLHTPRNVHRDDLTARVNRRRARVAVGESVYEEPEDADDESGAAEEKSRAKKGKLGRKRRSRYRPKPSRRGPRGDKAAPAPPASMGAYGGMPSKLADAFGSSGRPAAVSFDSLKKSTAAQAHAAQASGLTRFELATPVTVPDGSSTMVAVVNQAVKGEETFLFKPGGAGRGYESNPYRVVRFKNDTPFALEPGPISIYSGGSFVGEGISQAIGAGSSATIPFAVEPGIMVSQQTNYIPERVRLLKIVRGVIHVERFSRKKTKWTVKAQTKDDGFTVLVRHPKAGPRYELQDKPAKLEEVPGAYLLPVVVPKGKRTAHIEIIEQTPRRTTLSIWDGRATKVLITLLAHTELTAKNRKQLEPIVQLRQAIGKIDTKITGYKRQQRELDGRASQTRDNLRAMEKDKSLSAAKLRRDLQKRLDDFTKEGDRLGREIVKLRSERLQKKIALEDKLRNISLSSPDKKKK